MSRWFRHYAGMMRDDKLVRVAIRSKQSIERVAWVWGAILESAAEIDDGGRYDFDAAEAAYFLRADEADIHAIEAGLTDAGRVASGVVVKWSDRQFKSDRSAARQADYRERKRQAGRHGDDIEASSNVGVTSLSRHGDAPETEAETETQPSPAKASEGKARKRAAPSPEKPKFELPDWVPSEPWQAFVEMRRAMETGPKKVPFTVGAAKAIIADLERFRSEGHDLAAILTKSAVNSYRGVFAPDSPPKAPEAAPQPMDDAARAAYLAKLQSAPHLRGISTIDAPPKPNGSNAPRSFGQLAAGIASGVGVH